MKTMTSLNNSVANEGIDRCGCGSKYWENNKCIDCGEHVMCQATNPVPCDKKATTRWAGAVCEDHFYYALAVMNQANKDKS